MSNVNPLLTKLSLDNEIKHTNTMRTNWSYENVETKIWSIPKLIDFWGISSYAEKQLNKLSTTSIKELTNFNHRLLKKKFSVNGAQLWFHTNGVDENDVHKPYKPKSHSLGNSQILPRNYGHQRVIMVVLSEIIKQVTIPLEKRSYI